MAKILNKISYGENLDIVKVLCSAKEFAKDEDEKIVKDTFSYRYVLYFAIKDVEVEKNEIDKPTVISFFLCTNSEDSPSLSVINKLVDLYKFLISNN